MEHGNADNLFAGARRMTLTAEEKSSSREVLRSYMALTPARHAAAPAARRRASFSLRALTVRARTSVAAALAIGLTLSAAGVSYAAEDALPGDALYPVKTQVNERVQATLTLSGPSKAALETKLAERRLGEAETLAARGTLTASVRTELEAGFKKHADDAGARIAQLHADDDDAEAADITAALDGSLDAHARVMAAIADDQGNDEARKMADAVSRAAQDVSRTLRVAEDRAMKRRHRDAERNGDEAAAQAVTAAPAPVHQAQSDAPKEDADVRKEDAPDSVAPTAAPVAPGPRPDDSFKTAEPGSGPRADVVVRVHGRRGKKAQGDGSVIARPQETQPVNAPVVAQDVVAPPDAQPAAETPPSHARKNEAAQSRNAARLDARRRDAQRSVDEVRALLGRMRDKIGADAASDAERRLSKADEAIGRGDAVRGTDADAAADAYADAHKTAEETRVYIQASGAFKVRVRLLDRGDSSDARGGSPDDISAPKDAMSKGTITKDAVTRAREWWRRKSADTQQPADETK
ncbi:MAG: hypothetical protein RLZZ324_1100 [Candidatus Parcubacteria bacterium]|jgi:hypothetical protein